MKRNIFSLILGWVLCIDPAFTPSVAAAAQEAEDSSPKDSTQVEKPTNDIDKTVSKIAPMPPRGARRASARPSYRRGLQSRVAVLNDLSVNTNEVVENAVVVGGHADIDGTVEGNLVVVGGQAKLGPTVEVKGNLVMVGSILEADPAAKVGGNRVLVGSKQGPISLAWLRVPQEWFKNGLLYARPLPHQHAWAWIVSGVVVMLYFLLAVLFPRQVQASVNVLEAQPGRTFLLGLLVFFVSGPVLLLLIATGIGALLLPFILCAMVVVYLFGKVAVCRYAGQQIGALSGVGFLQKPLVALLTGAVLFCLLYAVPVVGFLVWAALFPLGVGAVWKAMFKRSEAKYNGVAPSFAVPGAPPMADFPMAAGLAYNPALLPRVGFWWRVLATGLDGLLVGLVCQSVHLTKWFLLVWVIYHVTLWALQGTTVGGILCGLKIVRSNGSPLNFGVALLRSLASFFSFVVLGLGFFWAGWSRERQSWHDKVADTIIVKLPKNAPVFAPPSSSLAPGAETK